MVSQEDYIQIEKNKKISHESIELQVIAVWLYGRVLETLCFTWDIRRRLEFKNQVLSRVSRDSLMNSI